jgi:putative CocE/NonD family hydrolase
LGSVERNVLIEMPDGVRLATDIHHPEGSGPHPTLLQRTCYDKDFLSQYAGLDSYLGAGYRVVFQDCRGSGTSEGEGDHFAESADGRVTADWIASQPWFDGRLATFGSSYMGFTQWALAVTRPPYLKAMAVGLTNSRVRSWFPGGSLALDIFLPWSMTRIFGFTEAEKPEFQARLNAAFMHLPLRHAVEVATGQTLPWYSRWMDHPSADDPFWKPLDFSDALTLDIPILFLDQWYDYATSHLVAEFEYRQEAGLPSRLHVGPGTHFSSDATQLEETLRWFNQHLKGGKPPAGTSVRVFVLPDVGWRDLAHWPPAGEPDTWFLAPGGALSREPCAIGDPTHYQYDAADPTPALGGPSLRMEHCGPRDNRPLEARDDVLTFTSPPLQAEAFTEGRVGVDLYLRSDVDHFDLYLRLCDVAPSGESINMSEELRRLTPGDIWRGHDGVFVISVELRPVAYRFAIGHCIRLQVSGGAHPMFARNTCSGEPVADATTIVVAHNAIYHDELHPSQVSLARPSSPLE